MFTHLAAFVSVCFLSVQSAGCTPMRIQQYDCIVGYLDSH